MHKTVENACIQRISRTATWAAVLNKNIADGNYAKTVLKMLARRLKEVGAAGTSASNIAVRPLLSCPRQC
eukprot:1137930-Rhodomonas_salina.2